MAGPSADSDPAQQQAEEYLEVLQSAYQAIEGYKLAQTFASLTPEELYDRFIERIEGKDTQARPNQLNRIAKLKTEVLAAIEKVKKLPADVFRAPDPSKDVTTPVTTTA
jgi:predicted RNA-binding Zn ribbon-like protein